MLTTPAIPQLMVPRLWMVDLWFGLGFPTCILSAPRLQLSVVCLVPLVVIRVVNGASPCELWKFELFDAVYDSVPFRWLATAMMAPPKEVRMRVTLLAMTCPIPPPGPDVESVRPPTAHALGSRVHPPTRPCGFPCACVPACACRLWIGRLCWRCRLWQ